jgi:hypothetical protein
VTKPGEIVDVDYMVDDVEDAIAMDRRRLLAGDACFQGFSEAPASRASRSRVRLSPRR